ncbi:MAG TPA: glutamate racemase [Patescibacteria group bacterium]|nr:glutamate racemase [Patescibacteria group bacterium]
MIGVFDSGLGGLTVVKEIRKSLPDADIIYLGDTARVPYGTRSSETIRKFAEEDTKFLLDKNVELIVVACNTVSSLALDVVKKFSNVSVLGVINPATKKALKVSKLKKIGLVGTRATVNSNAYKEVTMRRQASMLVPLIEEGFIEGPEIDLFIKKYFSDFKDRVDALILGCTHYPLIKDNINNYLGGKIKLIDPAEEVAKEVYEIAKDFKGTSKTRYFLTDVNKRFLETAKMFLGEDILDKVAKVEI